MTETWRERLDRLIKDRGEAATAVSIRAGCAPNYVHGLLRQGKEPTLDRLGRLARALDVSAAYLLTGATVSPETEEIIAALEGDPEMRAAILTLLSARRAP